MTDVKKIADEADMVVDGYAFKKCDNGYHVLNLDNPAFACVLSFDGKTVFETTMNDVEIGIVKDYFLRNKKNLEEE